ncbi:MAG: hypothetical protein N2111_02870 [Candidatus Sumerlaeaceae bacterium]|nr:hypothetical protein [Candidatus Sumerlaeaceae bacterium]
MHRVYAALCAGMVLLASGGCVLLGRTVLGGVPHGYDAGAYYFQGQTMATGRLVAPGTPFPEMFWMGNVVVEEGKRFGKYPPGWPAWLAVFMAAGVPWLANPVLAGACLAFIMASAWRLFGPREAVAAGALGLLSPFYMFMGADYLSHMACATGLALMLWASLRVVASAGGRASAAWGLCAAAGLGAAALTRPFSALLGCVGVVVVAVAGSGHHQRIRWIPAVAAGCPLLFLTVAAFLAYNAATTGDPLLFGHRYYAKDFSFLGEQGEHRSSVWENLAANAPRALAGLHRQIWGIPLSDLAPAVAALALIRRREVAALAAAVVFFAVAHSFYYFFDSYYGPRLLFETMPFLLILSGAGLVALWRESRTRGHSLLIRHGVPVVCALLLAMAVTTYFPERVGYYSTNYCGQGADLLRVVREKRLSDAIVFLRVRDGFHYNNVALLNNPDLSRSRPLFAHYVAGKLDAARAVYPRREAWILEASFRGIVGPDGYPDRFVLERAEWIRLP